MPCLIVILKSPVMGRSLSRVLCPKEIAVMVVRTKRMDKKRVSLSFMINSPMISEHVRGTKGNYQKLFAYSRGELAKNLKDNDTARDQFAALALARLPLARG